MLFDCTVDLECTSGFVCLQGVCRPEGTKLDAGIDGGDGGESCIENFLGCDAGFDAGPTDAGMDGGDGGSDAGNPDSGTDAGFDAGIPDAGPAWTPIDIGTFIEAGTVTYNGNRITVTMHAGDIWNAADDFYYLHQTRSGDIQITAQVFSVDAGSVWGKAGVMIRQDLTRESPNAFVSMTMAQGHSFQVRDAGSGLTGPGVLNFTMTERAPYWVRLVRQGGFVKAYHSPDGGDFVQFGSLPDPFTDPVYVGLAVSSEVFTQGNISQFRSVVLTVP
jgi:hypothetical protein